MLKPIMSIDDIVRYISQKTCIYKKDVRLILDALGECMMENMALAEPDRPTEFKLFSGIKMGGKFVPARVMPNPKSREDFVAVERVKPYCIFSRVWKKRINEIDRMIYTPEEDVWEMYDRQVEAEEKYSDN